jgi:hypothetical protein
VWFSKWFKYFTTNAAQQSVPWICGIRRLVRFQAKDIDTNSKCGFEEMDKALKARAEHAR